MDTFSGHSQSHPFSPSITMTSLHSFAKAAFTKLPLMLFVSAVGYGRLLPNSGLSLDIVSRPLIEQDVEFINIFRNAGGPNANVQYGDLTNPGKPLNCRQATRMKANITRAIYVHFSAGQSGNPQTKVPTDASPPGYQPGQGFERSHLLAARLGGSGRDARNIVTGYKEF